MSSSSENDLPDSQRLHEILRGYYFHEMNDNWFRWKAYSLFTEIAAKRGCKSVNQSSKSNYESDSCMVYSYCLMIIDFQTNYIEDIDTEGLNLQDENLLTFFAKKWASFETATKKLDIIYQPFRVYFTNRDKRYKNVRIYTVALILWQLLSKNISRRVFETVMKMIDKERSGDVTSRSLVQESMRLLIHIDKEVENARKLTKPQDVALRILGTELRYYKKTRNFYELQSVEMVSRYNVTDYIRKVKNIFFEETNNCKRVYRMQQFAIDLMKACLSRIFIKNQLSILVRYFCGLLAANEETMLADFYTVLKMSENSALYKFFSNCFYDSVILDGKCIMENRAQEFLNHPELYIAAVLQITRKYIALVKTSFEDNEYFSKGNKEALSSILNYSIPTGEKSTFESAKLFAIYCDYVLKNPKADMLLRDDEVVYLFECLEEKCAFRETFYELVVESLTCMASINEQRENDLLFCVHVFWDGCHSSIAGVNIKEMIRDIKTSNELSEKVSLLTDSDTELNIKVLKDENWPFSRQCFVGTLSRSLFIKIESFSELYKITYPQRKLTVLHRLSRADVTTHCFKKPYTFHMNLNQLSLIIQFNAAKNYSIKKLQEGTRIDQKDFSQVLQRFIKVGILKYEGDTENPDCRTNVILNLNYQNEKEYVIVNEFKNEIREHRRNDYIIPEENKCLAIQAAIVRIMKNKLSLHHEELVAQTFEVLKTKFVFTPDMVDKSIEKLTEREFIKKSQECEKHYVYIP